jgi:hypothetical protein
VQFTGGISKPPLGSATDTLLNTCAELSVSNPAWLIVVVVADVKLDEALTGGGC